MSRTKESDYFNASFDVSNPSLKSWFGKVSKGQSQIFDTPFAKGESTNQMLKEWKKVLRSICTQWPSLWAFENDLAGKVGPMSVQLPLSQRMDDVDSYYDGVLLPSEPLRSSAIRATESEFRQMTGLAVRSEVKTVELMKKSTNSGSPLFIKKHDAVSQTVPCSISPRNEKVLQRLHSGSWYAAAVLGWRGQEGGPQIDDVKQRVIWMFPFAVNIRELQVYQPFIEAAQNLNLVPAWVSMESVDLRVTNLFETKRKSDLVVCTDFSKFDQHFNSKLQDASKEILRYVLVPNAASAEWLTNVYPIKYMIPLAYGWEKVRFGPHGMGSGSGGTNCDETLAHRTLQYEAAQINGERLNPNSQCLGDDGILSYPGITVEDVVKAYQSHGLEMNLTKQYASTQDCVYLRRWHHVNYRMQGVCVGVYSTCRALGRLRYLERWMNPDVWDSKAVALRQLSILENCKYHPLREQFIQFCMKRDKYRLGIDIPHFLDDIETIAREKMNLMPDFIGYTKTLQATRSGVDSAISGISSWWVVQYLKSLK